MATAKSIHIGLNVVDPNAYGGWDGQLNGCVNDANGIKGLADALGYASTILTNSQATSFRVIQEIVAAAQSLQPGDILLLTYSGHGGQVDDANSDEADAKDETWVLYDRELIDDELYALWSQFAAGVRIFVLSDSCHSGTVAKQVMTEDAQAARAQRRKRSRATNAAEACSSGTHEGESAETGRAQPDSQQEQWQDVPKAMPRQVERQVNERDRGMYNTLQWISGPARNASVNANVLLISGCQDNQLSYDGSYFGQFTGTLLQVWDNGAFQGDYQSFHRDILNLMPPEQSPNYYTVGTPNSAFEQQRPFTTASPSGGIATTTPATPPASTSRPTVKRGSTGDAVRYLQQRLKDLGHSTVVDGYFGSQTETRVREFQTTNGLAADGIVGPATWAALEQTSQPGSGTPASPGTSTPSSAQRPVLSRGATGDDVAYLQQLLQAHGYNLSVDRIFGPLTESFVRDFQRTNGLAADGVVGPLTWSVLTAP